MIGNNVVLWLNIDPYRWTLIESITIKYLINTEVIKPGAKNNKILQQCRKENIQVRQKKITESSLKTNIRLY